MDQSAGLALAYTMVVTGAGLLLAATFLYLWEKSKRKCIMWKR